MPVLEKCRTISFSEIISLSISFFTFRGTEIIANDKILRDALQEDRFTYFKIK